MRHNGERYSFTMTDELSGSHYRSDSRDMDTVFLISFVFMPTYTFISGSPVKREKQSNYRS